MTRNVCEHRERGGQGEVEPFTAPRLMLPFTCDEVHVWTADLDRAPAGRLGQTLEPQERARAARFRLPDERRHFLARRGVLREILAAYTGQAPDKFRFVYTQFGKPALAPESAAGDLRFNLSHSAGVALYAVARKREVGIDLERILPHVVTNELIERVMSQAEVFALYDLPCGVQGTAFFDCWTRKEAYLKALGKGLQIEPGSFAVSFAPGKPAALLEGTDPRWSVQALAPTAGYAAAVSAEGQGWQVRVWSWK